MTPREHLLRRVERLKAALDRTPRPLPRDLYRGPTQRANAAAIALGVMAAVSGIMVLCLLALAALLAFVGGPYGLAVLGLFPLFGAALLAFPAALAIDGVRRVCASNLAPGVAWAAPIAGILLAGSALAVVVDAYGGWDATPGWFLGGCAALAASCIGTLAALGHLHAGTRTRSTDPAGATP